MSALIRAMAKRQFVAFLRAVNVGGRFVTMERLRALFANLGLERVRSHIQSGNVFFETARTDRKALEREIAEYLAAELGFECPAFLRTPAELEKALSIDAFARIKVTPDVRLAVLFTADPLPKKLALPHRSPKGDCDIVAATASELFIVARNLGGRPGNPLAYVEKTLGITGTIRFHATAVKILEAAKGKA